MEHGIQSGDENHVFETIEEAVQSAVDIWHSVRRTLCSNQQVTEDSANVISEQCDTNGEPYVHLQDKEPRRHRTRRDRSDSTNSVGSTLQPMDGITNHR